MDISAADHVIAAGAAVLAGLVNAVAGGGTLISFPTLVAIGLPTVASNVTNTVALCPGYFGGTFAQRADLRAQRGRLPSIVVASALGGLLGSTLLVISPEKLFRTIVPFMLLLACALLAFGDRIKSAVRARQTRRTGLPVQLVTTGHTPLPGPTAQPAHSPQPVPTGQPSPTGATGPTGQPGQRGHTTAATPAEHTTDATAADHTIPAAAPDHTTPADADRTTPAAIPTATAAVASGATAAIATGTGTTGTGSADPATARTPRLVVAAVFAIGVYAGYFGAGMGIVALAVMGIALDESMVRVNALKQLVAMTANIVAACFFVFSGKVDFSLALIMAPASLVGGSVGGRVVQYLNPRLLRTVVIAIGLAVAINFWV